MKIVNRLGNRYGNVDVMFRFIGIDLEIFKQCKMLKDYKYDGFEEVIIKCMKEGVDD